MFNALLKPLTALGGLAPRVDAVGDWTLTEDPDWAIASVAARAGTAQALEAKVQEALGLSLPPVGQACRADPFAAFWTGPEQWFVMAPHATHEQLAGQIKGAVGDLASVTEQNDGWVCFGLTGAGLVPVFQRLCAADLAQMGNGRAVRTAIEHLGCFVVCWEKGTRYAVLGPRSSAASLHHAILTAMRSAA